MAFILAMLMCLSLGSCGKNKKAFEASKVAYENIDAAYTVVEQFATDIYDAWMVGIYDDEELMDDGIEYLASELSLSEEELRAGAVHVYAHMIGEEASSLTEEEKTNATEYTNVFFILFEDDLFTLCVEFVMGAYIENGKVDEVNALLENAKLQMKELSEKYSDYEYYPSLKEYYTTTRSFFDFCQDPTGSFEQIKGTINDYKNDARDYSNDLKYIFEE